MNDSSASPGNSPNQLPPLGKIRIWDAPVRVGHWLMVLCFFGAYFTAESERWRLVHVTLGYSLFGLVVFRLIWGVIGTRYARFSEFVRGPKAVLAYLRSLLRGKPLHYLGHNPAGALAILALLALSVGLGVTGYLLYNSDVGETYEEVHEVLANLMLGLVIVHILAVLLSSHLHKENLLKAMLDGFKRGQPEAGIRRNMPLLAGLLLAAVLAFGYWQWLHAPRPNANNAYSANNASNSSLSLNEHEERNHEADENDEIDESDEADDHEVGARKSPTTNPAQAH